jgi:hypothetical protein
MDRRQKAIRDGAVDVETELDKKMEGSDEV